MKNTKRFAAYVLAGFMGLTVCSQPFQAMAQAWSRVGDTYQMTDGTPIAGVVSRGIDVSHWKQDIDWNQVAGNDVDFVMLGTRYKGEVDPYFRINADGAYQAGIDLGAYIYSYATTPEMAEQEADFILDLIKDYPISYPVAFDAEDAGTLGTLSPSQVSEIINTFCKKIEDAGYHPMLYANDYWLNNKIDMSMIDYDVWVARYNILHTYENPAMWQATSTGSVGGVKGNVDIDFLYKDYSNVIPADTWRHIAGNTYYYKNHLMQKSTWIDDGQGWYYMNEAGNPAKGWMTFPEGKYYLEESTGKMARNWKQLDGAWHYFGDNGLVNTGWFQVGDERYYADGEGRMQTGWQNLDGKQYYLKDSGAAAIGWNTLDNSNYYFESSGEMATGWKDLGGSWYYLNQEGKMQTGWQDITGDWYYLGQEGVMQTGWQMIDGSWYYMEPSGRMAKGWTDLGGGRYYLSDSGAMQTGWQDMDGSRYYFASSGEMARGWIKLNDIWYYLDGEGRMQTGWQELDGSRYYLDGEGKMAANTTLELDGIKYQADGSGVCTQIQEENPVGAGEGENAGQTAETADPGQNQQSGPGDNQVEETRDPLEDGPGFH